MGRLGPVCEQVQCCPYWPCARCSGGGEREPNMRPPPWVAGNNVKCYTYIPYSTAASRRVKQNAGTAEDERGLLGLEPRSCPHVGWKVDRSVQGRCGTAGLADSVPAVRILRVFLRVKVGQSTHKGYVGLQPLLGLANCGSESGLVVVAAIVPAGQCRQGLVRTRKLPPFEEPTEPGTRSQDNASRCQRPPFLGSVPL